MSEVFELLGEKVQALVKNQVCAVEEKCPSKKPKVCDLELIPSVSTPWYCLEGA